ncbi:hypothetical protein COU74_01380 [Candidatus Peregrinibacteria bacterium CG10_big_fil_rev_8_21_14_0_10_36_19]|nr:MAG: hypothetical protein COU74_01380 [Candidatus Peregrinibacteria bacterium CG10_big_fil_rev_8_21_14_0_10_36_19]
MPPELTVFFLAMTPFLEIKLAIPLGLKLGLSKTSTIAFATAGTIIPAMVGLAAATPITNFLRKNSPIMDKFLTFLFNKTRKDHSKSFEKYEALFIFMLVATPLPGTGASAGALIAYLFGVEYWKACSLFILGTIVSALLLLTGIESIFALTSLFN